MCKDAFLSLFLIFGAVVGLPAASQENSQDEMRSLDEQVQGIKTDVLGIAKDLSLLEERLLYPSNTEVSVFVEMGAEDSFRLDAVHIDIDGTPVTHHIYSFKELDALQHGGVQRLYTGNVTSGAHELTVAVNGKLSSGKDFTSEETFSFSKAAEPKLLGLTFAGRSDGASIALGNW